MSAAHDRDIERSTTPGDFAGVGCLISERGSSTGACRDLTSIKRYIGTTHPEQTTQEMTILDTLLVDRNISDAEYRSAGGTYAVRAINHESS
jgi:hypothetical protein